jgi:hypothetical protein
VSRDRCTEHDSHAPRYSLADIASILFLRSIPFRSIHCVIDMWIVPRFPHAPVALTSMSNEPRGEQQQANRDNQTSGQPERAP